MKILALIGSPRKGNSYNVTKQVESVMKDLDEDVTFEYIFLHEADIKMCRGCFACLSVGEEYCSLDDDVESIKQEMLDSDGVIFVSPVYVMNVTGLIKNFIDRLAYVCHRPIFYRKYAMAISTTGAIGLDKVLNYLSTVAKTWMFTSVVKLGLQTPPDRKDAINLNDIMDKKVVNAAKEFYKNIKEKRHRSPDLESVIQFRVQRALFLAQKEEDRHLIADYDFYKDKINQEFYYKTKVNPIKNFIAWIVEKLVLFKFRKSL